MISDYSGMPVIENKLMQYAHVTVKSRLPHRRIKIKRRKSRPVVSVSHPYFLAAIHSSTTLFSISMLVIKDILVSFIHAFCL